MVSCRFCASQSSRASGIDGLDNEARQTTFRATALVALAWPHYGVCKLRRHEVATTTLGFTQTSVGKKVLVAVTGLFMFLFVIAHLLGNLQIFAGPEGINNYAKMLRSMPALLWAARFVLLACVLIHSFLAVTLWLESRDRQGRSKYGRYKGSESKRKGKEIQETVTHAKPVNIVLSKAMIYTGPVIFLYIVWHIVNLTLGAGGYPSHQPFEHLNVYANVIATFSLVWNAAIYILMMLALGAHLMHGAWSMFQTAGFNSMDWSERIRAGAYAVTGLIVLGNISIPLAVQFGIIK
jgi:succinate dehydrogenase / fumarate reductase cytochrome b subunit